MQDKHPAKPHLKKFTKHTLSTALAALALTGVVNSTHAATLSLSAPTSVNEADGSTSISISVEPEFFGEIDDLSSSCTVSGNIVFASSDSSATNIEDFNIPNNSFTIEYTVVNDDAPAGKPTKLAILSPGNDVSINIIDDSEVEDDETMVFSAQNVTTNCSFYGGLNNDNAGVAITIADNDEENNGAGDTPETPTLTTTSRQVLNNMGTISLEGAKLQAQNLSKQIRRLRSGLRGNDLSSLNLEIDGQRLSGNDLKKLLGAGAGDAGLNSQWGSFVGGTIQVGDADETDSNAGYEFNVDTFFAGVDYKLNESVIIGGAIGYTDSLSEIDNDAGETGFSGLSVGLFTSYYWKDVYYFDGIISYGQSDYDTDRRLEVGGNTVSAKGETDGNEFTLALNTGYYFRKANHGLQIFGSLNYIDASIDGFTERSNSNSITLLGVDDQNQKSLTTNLGIEYGLAINTRSAVVTPQISLDWEHQYKDDTESISGRFIGDPDNTTFRVERNNQDKDYFNLGLSISAVFKGGFSAYTAYEVDLGRDDLDLYDISIGARWEF